MDITETTVAKSDQQNFDDYLVGPRTVTITEVKAGTAEQPVEVHLLEYPGRPYKPSKSMRRVLVAAWGPEGAVYAGRRMQLVGDPTVKYGGVVVGGIKIAKLSHLEKRLTVSLTETRGKRKPHTVEPLPDAPVGPTAEQVAASVDQAELRAWWGISGPDIKALIRARVETLNKPADNPQPTDDDRADEAAQLFADQP